MLDMNNKVTTDRKTFANNSLSLAIGFKTGILFSLKMVYLYWDMSEVMPVVYMYCIINIVHLVDEIKKLSALL